MGIRHYISVGSFVILVGCGEPFLTVAKPKAITFEAAMAELGRGFTAFESASANSPRGLVPCTVDVSFDISVAAQASDTMNVARTGSLVVTGVSGQTTTGSNLSGGFSRDRSADRGSKIRVQLRHLQCLPTDTRAATGEQLREVADAVDGTNGVMILNIPPSQ